MLHTPRWKSSLTNLNKEAYDRATSSEFKFTDYSDVNPNQSKLKGSNLVLGKIRYKNSDIYKEGKVIDQTYSVNQKVEEGTAIGVTISLGPQKKVTYKYYGDAVITYNPFEFEDESGRVKIILSQSGHSKTVLNEELTYEDFPYQLSDVEGYDESNGTLTMYVDGEQRGDSVTISFTKVEQ